MNLSKYILLSCAFSLAALTGCADKADNDEAVEPTLETSAVSRGEISKIINGTGTVRPEITVEVGTEVSGRILSVSVDYNSVVKKGDILAEIDPENLQNRVEQNLAQVENRSSDITIQKAALKRAEVNAAQAKRSLERRQKLFDEEAISQSQLEQSERTMNLAVADLELSKARVAGALSSLKQSEANLRTAKVNLSRAVIRAPIDGMVIERLVDPGQTVAASLSAPKLFRIAGDLSKIQVDAAIVEGDVSGLDAGDKTTFNVDAYPGRAFSGVVEQLRFKSEKRNNIVTYTAVIKANNDERLLMPGMTANLQITTNSKTGILRIPTTAERFRPTPDQIKKWKAAEKEDGKEKDAAPKARARLLAIGLDAASVEAIMTLIKTETEDVRERIADPTQIWRRVSNQKTLRDIVNKIIKDELNSVEYQAYRQAVQADAKTRDAELWVKDGEKMRQVTVGLGLSDGSFTEVLEGLSETDVIVTGIGSSAPDKKAKAR